MDETQITQTPELQQEQTTETPQNDTAQQPQQETETKPTEPNYENTGLSNLKEIASQKGVNFDEIQTSYIANNCQLTDEMRKKCEDAGIPADFITRATEGIKALHDKEMNDVSAVVGGRETLTKTLEWGKQNLSKEELADFQADLSSNPSLTTAQAIVFFIHNKMINAEGKAPNYIDNTTGGSTLTDIFKSKAEALKSMSDPRFDSTHKDFDEAYAKEIEEKLNRTKQANNGVSFFG
jgi:hypothetical protein